MKKKKKKLKKSISKNRNKAKKNSYKLTSTPHVNIWSIYMKDNGIECRQMINPIHQAKHFHKLFKRYKESDYYKENS